MVVDRGIASLLAATALCLATHAGAQVLCKNHYILQEKCGPEWVPASEGLPDLDVRALAIDPVNPAKLYAGGRSFLFHTADAGQSWARTGLAIEEFVQQVRMFGRPAGTASGHEVTVITIDPRRPERLYVGTQWYGGCHWNQEIFFRSVDGAKTWDAGISRGFGGCERITAVVPDPMRPDHFYFSHFDYSFGDTYAPFRTTSDGFQSWRNYPQPLVPVLAADPHKAGVVYGGTLALDWDWYGLYGQGVLKSVDGGETWKATGLMGRGVSAIATATGENVSVHAAGFTQEYYGKPQLMDGIFRSSDGGDTWVPGEGLEELIGTTSLVTALVVHPGEPEVIYAATSGAGVWRSVDGGLHWMPMNDGLPSLVVRALVATKGNPNTVYAGTPLGVFRIEDRR